jgi:hypothetical protein
MVWIYIDVCVYYHNINILYIFWLVGLFSGSSPTRGFRVDQFGSGADNIAMDGCLDELVAHLPNLLPSI